MRDRAGWQFDLITQRFLEGRWNTPLGATVLARVIEGIKNMGDIRGILDDYVLDHPANKNPYGYPYYPPEAMDTSDFWVLTQDDLRGAHFYSEHFSHCSLAKKSLSYCRFHGCNLDSANLERTDLSYASLENCDLRGTVLAVSGGFSTKFLNCDLRGACLWDSGFLDSDFSGSDLRGAYFEGVVLEDPTLNYQTKFDEELAISWSTRSLPPAQRPDILRSIRIGYEKAQVWHLADRFLLRERIEARKHINWPLVKQHRDLNSLAVWLGDWISAMVSGHGTKPFRVIIVAVSASIVFALLYYGFGVPHATGGPTTDMLQALYFSFTTFTTLGYGDVAYSAARPLMRLMSTIEAWTGAISIAMFVTVLARKAFR